MRRVKREYYQRTSWWNINRTRSCFKHAFEDFHPNALQQRGGTLGCIYSWRTPVIRLRQPVATATAAPITSTTWKARTKKCFRVCLYKIYIMYTCRRAKEKGSFFRVPPPLLFLEMNYSNSNRHRKRFQKSSGLYPTELALSDSDTCFIPRPYIRYRVNHV